MTLDARHPDDIVGFWAAAGMARWFACDPAFEAEFAARFTDAYLEAAACRLKDWVGTATGARALLILLDQFPRDAFRGTAHAYATDGLALALARRFLCHGIGRDMPADLRMFFALPFTHSERLADQEISRQEWRALGPSRERRAAEHLAVIRRFGRSPHRNPVLGRDTTQEEARFRAGGGFAG